MFNSENAKKLQERVIKNEDIPEQKQEDHIEPESGVASESTVSNKKLDSEYLTAVSDTSQPIQEGGHAQAAQAPVVAVSKGVVHAGNKERYSNDRQHNIAGVDWRPIESNVQKTLLKRAKKNKKVTPTKETRFAPTIKRVKRKRSQTRGNGRGIKYKRY
ncbi:unnamed protein product [Allacma fusca]|uniref:Uncharacterized protein n=1 Tax=Allacma fusca TaxID=39272 RepID=A0A8J2L736_9HEXA|nr:unnamed protein product [Allacma fusca]